MSSKGIRRGARVLVIAGNDRGKTGEVLSKDDDRVLVQGVNVRKKHMKRTQQTQGGRVIEMEVPIHISNVLLWDAKTGGPSKAKRTRENGKLIRIAKKSGEVIK